MIKFLLYDNWRGYTDITDKFEKVTYFGNMLTFKYGKTFILQPLGLPPTIFTSDPLVMEHILKSKFENYIKGPLLMDVLREIFGDGIFNTNGNNWKTQRLNLESRIYLQTSSKPPVQASRNETLR